MTILIGKLLSDGYTAADIACVINKMAKRWIGTKYQNALTPSTLFGKKFDEYLNAPEAPPKAETEGTYRV